jgi:hypothetical protein
VQIVECLRLADTWDQFDVFRLHELSGGRSLQVLGWHILEKHGLMCAAILTATARSPPHKGVVTCHPFPSVFPARLIRRTR